MLCIMLLFVLLRALIQQIPDQPRWLQIQKQRLSHFSSQLNRQSEARLLAAAIAQVPRFPASRAFPPAALSRQPRFLTSRAFSPAALSTSPLIALYPPSHLLITPSNSWLARQWVVRTGQRVTESAN